MALITYDDKSNSLPTSNPRRIYSADDANEVKTVVNANYAEHAAATAALQAAILALKWKAAVKVATTANGTLASAFANGQTVDGVTLVTGDRILLKNQSDQTANGIYTVNTSGAPTRATDADSASELEGAAVLVQQGTTNANTSWQQTTDGITLGSSNIVWATLGTGLPAAAQVTFTPTGTLSATDVQAAIEELDSEKAPLESPDLTGTPTAPTAAPSTNTTQVASTEFVQQEIGANSLGFDPADELTEIAGITLEGDITVAQLLEALEIPFSRTIHADNAAMITLTNSANSETALGSSAAHYTRINTTNIRQMRLVAYVPTKSASVNNPRMYIQYSTNGGSAWTTLGAGTIASGDVISLFTGSANIGFTNWITLPGEARGNDITFRIVTHGGDGAADPVVGNIHIEGKT